MISARLKTGLTLAALMLLVAAGPVRAEIPASGIAQLDAAYAELDRLYRLKRDANTVPRLSDPASAKALASFWDAPAILGKPPYEADDVPQLITIVEKQSQVLKMYLFFSPNPILPPDTVQNAVTFQDEVMRSHAFLVRSAGAVMPALGALIGALPPSEMNEARVKGLRQVRLGMQQIVSSAAFALRSNGLTPENQALVVASFADNAAALAQGTTLADRKATAATMEAALPALAPASRTRMQAFIKAMSDQRCEGLCALE
ncbi:hypothetical protein [Bosea sp. (in: a-proteobacteria)]|jgi:hypothetical protein|uniref:hypothetical protein n=1 Tax=Bosea sp. (in: a-proteobacteria) TaxID=1871050 RepID=UPI003F707A5C